MDCRGVAVVFLVLCFLSTRLSAVPLLPSTHNFETQHSHCVELETPQSCAVSKRRTAACDLSRMASFSPIYISSDAPSEMSDDDLPATSVHATVKVFTQTKKNRNPSLCKPVSAIDVL